MTEVLHTHSPRREGGHATERPIDTERPIGVQILTARGRSSSLPRHEEDLSAQEGEEKPDARFPEALEDAGRQERPEAAARQGPQAAHAERTEEVSGRSGVRLRKAARLTLRGDFVAAQERGRRLHAGAYLVLALPNQLGRPRLGVTVSRRVGNAVVRNRVKRWVREAFRAVAADVDALDLVVIARSAAPEAGLAGARRALESARRSRGRP
jgi:ribonuclease P protein component